jgi:hypothetical protein
MRWETLMGVLMLGCAAAQAAARLHRMHKRYKALRYCSLARRVRLTRVFWQATQVHNEIRFARVIFTYVDGQTSAHPKDLYARAEDCPRENADGPA